jgi:glycerate kinase
LEVLGRALGAELRTARVDDPLGRPVEAVWGWLPERRLAILESAQAVGLPRLRPEERDPVRADTRGVGQLVLEALAAGAQTLWVGLGGSATADAGAGMLQALGARWSPESGELEVSGLDARLGRTQIVALCDVLGPLLGPRGARLYLPQKGATPEQLDALERRLARLADAAERVSGGRVRDRPGAAAAGGLGAAFAMLGARLVSGTELVFEVVRLRSRLEACDAVIGGEGRLDEQTLEGKPLFSLARLTRELGRPLIALCGSRAADLSALHAAGVTAAFPIGSGPATEPEALAGARLDLERTAEQIGRLLGRGERRERLRATRAERKPDPFR